MSLLRWISKLLSTSINIQYFFILLQRLVVLMSAAYFSVGPRITKSRSQMFCLSQRLSTPASVCSELKAPGLVILSAVNRKSQNQQSKSHGGEIWPPTNIFYYFQIRKALSDGCLSAQKNCNRLQMSCVLLAQILKAYPFTLKFVKMPDGTPMFKPDSFVALFH